MNNRVLRIFSLIMVFILLISLLSLSSCSTRNNAESGKLKIVATLFPQYDFAREIAGDKAEVSMLLPPGTDSHSFDPSFSDIESMTDADLIIYTGNAMESWAKVFIDAVKDKNCTILDVSKNITAEKIDDNHKTEDESHNGEDEHSDNVDPHIWTSPENAIIMVEDILTTLCSLDKKNSEYYRENAKNYLIKLRQLDDTFSSIISGAKRNKIYFGEKFAFLYFINYYKLDYMSAYDSCSEHAEPSPKHLTEMITEMKDNEIPVIFYAELTKPNVAKTISEKTGAKLLLLHSCHNLTKEEFENGGNYLSIMLQNAENLKEALY